MTNSEASLEPVLQWECLRPGQEYPEVRCTADDRFVDAYLKASGETHPQLRGFVPPLSLIYVRFAKQALGGRWPNGSLQLNQKLRNHRALRRGEDVAMGLRLGTVETRNGRRYFELLSRVQDARGEPVCEHSATLLWVSPGSLPPAPRAARPAQSPAATAVASHAANRLGPRVGSFPMARVRAYAAIAGARDPVHIDPDYARTTPLGQNIVQGKLALSPISMLMLEHLGLQWMERGWLDVQLRRPVIVGASVRAFAESAGDAHFSVWCENSDGERLIEGSAGA